MESEVKMILATDLDGTFLHPDLPGASSELYKLIGDHREEIEFRMIDLIRRVKEYDLKAWGLDFLSFRDPSEKSPTCARRIR